MADFTSAVCDDQLGARPVRSLTPRLGEGVRQSSSAGVPVVDLFAGAGGLSVGARWAGGDVRLAVEVDPVGCETLRRNGVVHSGFTCDKDVRLLEGEDLRSLAGVGKREELIVVGGPPCQGFSKAAFWTEDGDSARYRRARAEGVKTARPVPRHEPHGADERRALIYEFYRLTVGARAQAFVFENVPSLLAPRHRPMLDRLLKAFEDTGYSITLVKANAVDYGVPQKRQRIFVLGARGTAVRQPVPTHFFGDQPAEDRLPAITAGRSLAPFGDERYAESAEVVTGKWASHLAEVPPGWNYKYHTEWGGHPNPSFVTETRYWNFLLKLSPDLPSWTIPANPGPWAGPFHWKGRRLRTVELAALQGFPKGYEFAGSRRDQVRQIGNAVPPPLAQHMIHSVIEAVV